MTGGACVPRLYPAQRERGARAGAASRAGAARLSCGGDRDAWNFPMASSADRRHDAPRGRRGRDRDRGDRSQLHERDVGARHISATRDGVGLRPRMRGSRQRGRRGCRTFVPGTWSWRRRTVSCEPRDRRCEARAARSGVPGTQRPAALPIVFPRRSTPSGIGMRLRRGERVLIHAGQQAESVSPRSRSPGNIGAEVYATAGSAEERALVALGVKHVMAFAGVPRRAVRAHGRGGRRRGT